MRRGVAYIVESFVAMLMLFVFAIGAQSTAEAQDWSSYSLQVEAQDLTEVVEATGGLDVLERGETGTFRTFARHVSEGDLAVSGSIDIPVNEFSIGFPVLSDQRQNNQLEELDSSGCKGELDEINNESGNILKPQNDMFDARLYIADTDPRSASDNGVLDYDTLYVDNETKCQFNPSEGPFYPDDYFNYSNGSSGRLFQFKGVDEEGASRNLVYHNASQVARFRDLTKKRLNGIETSLTLDTINISEASLPDYQLLVFRRNPSLSQLIGDSPSDSSRERIKAFADRGGSILLLMNLEEDDFRSGSFLSSTDLDWVTMSNEPLSPPPKFTEGSASVSTKDFFLGLGGDFDDVTLYPDGTVSSHGSQGIVQEPVLAYEDAYSSMDWDVSAGSMSRVLPGNVEGEPESGCYSDADVSSSDSLTEGSLSLPTSAGSVEPMRVISAELGKDDEFCQNNDVRALMIDYDDDGEFETSEGEGPFVEGDTVARAGREYRPVLPNPSTVELDFVGGTHLEVVNYLGSHGSGELARMEYRESYSLDNRRLVTAVMYKLLPDNSVFGSDATSVPLSVLSSTNQSFYMPYTASLRWGEG